MKASIALTVILAVVLTCRLMPACASPVVRPPDSRAKLCRDPGIFSAQKAFGEPMDDLRALAFLIIVGNLEVEGQKRVRQRADNRQFDEDSQSFVKPLIAKCEMPRVSVGVSRFDYEIAQYWDDGGDDDLIRAAFFAFASIELGDRISTSQRDAMLAPFETSTEQLDTLISSTGRRTRCRSVAKLIAKRDLVVPMTQPYDDLRGHLHVTVSLDDHGFVRSASLRTSDLGMSEVAAKTIEATIIAAAASLYGPASDRCHGKRSTFDFTEDVDDSTR